MLHLIQKYRSIGTKELSSPLCSEQAVTEMVKIPGGTFVMGSNDHHGYDNEKAYASC